MNIGIDLGGTNVRVGLVDRKGVILSRASTASRTSRGPEAVAETIVELSRKVAGKRWSRVRGMGMGIPGPLSRNRKMIVATPNIGWENIPFPEILEKAASRPVVMENDANVAAFGEYAAGAGKGAECMLMYTLGTGIGGGIVQDGRIWDGVSGGAGEVGHIIAVPGGRPCGCGLKGCIEEYASATGIAMSFKERTGKEMEVRDIFRSSSPAAKKTIGDAIRMLALSIQGMVNVLNPDRVVIGGGVSLAGPKLMKPLAKELSGLVFPSYWKAMKLVRARLGDDAGIIGAAMLSSP